MITDSEAKELTPAQVAEIAAASATGIVQEMLDRARTAIDEAQAINALGAFVDRASTLAQIGAARKALNDAFYILSTTRWPEQRTYEAVEQ